MQPSFLLWIQLKKNNIGFAQHGPYFYITSMKQSRCFLFNDQRHSNHFPEEKLFYSHEGWYQSFQLVILRTAAARGPCCKHQVQMTALTENMGNIFLHSLLFYQPCCNISRTNTQITAKCIYDSCPTSSIKETIIIRNKLKLRLKGKQIFAEIYFILTDVIYVSKSLTELLSEFQIIDKLSTVLSAHHIVVVCLDVFLFCYNKEQKSV